MKILFISDSPQLYTGQARTIRELANRFFRDKHIVMVGGWHHYRVIPSNAIRVDYPVYNIDKMNHENAKGQVLAICQRFKPDIIFCHGDLFNFIWLPFIRAFIPEVKTYGYMNVDSDPLRYDLHIVVDDGFDWISATTNYAKSKIEELVPNIKKIDVVYHGVNTKIFKPNGNNKSEKFTILINSINAFRKMLPISIEGFYLFAKDKNDVLLKIITDPIGADTEGYDISSFTDNLGIGHKVEIISNSFNKGISDYELNSIYNESHVLLLCSLGEGFGLPILEAMAAGCTVVAIGYSGCAELIDDGRGLSVSSRGHVYGSYGQRLPIPSPEDIAGKLDILYRDWKSGSHLIEGLIDKGIKFANQYSWDRCYNLIKNNCERLLSTNNKIRITQDPIIPKLRYVVMHSRKNLAKGKLYIGCVKQGGYGDTLQLIPVLKGIRRKYPDSFIFAIVKLGKELLYENADLIIETQVDVGFNSLLKTLRSAFDLFFDMRYISVVYENGEPISNGYERYIDFYNGWAYSNSRIHTLNKHVIDLMLESVGLSGYASIDDMKVITKEPENKPTKNRYITIHNSAGDLGYLKLYPKEELEEIIKFVISLGYDVVQLGTKQDPPLLRTIDWRGKSDLLETAWIVEHSRLHIGVEGFIYHLAKAVGTKALTWFTITPKVCFAYPEMINLGRELCPPCWWSSINVEWYKKCWLGNDRCLNLPSVDEIKRALEGELRE